MRHLLFVASLLASSLAPAAPDAACDFDVFKARGRLLYADDFAPRADGPLAADSRWLAEIAPKPGSSVTISQGRLLLDTAGGVTVWLDLELPATGYLIEYRRRVVLAGGPNDRLSDLNQFWQASDPRQPGRPPFGRDGVFESYDDLQLYYVGMGGNSNTSTRLRKYEGGERRLLQEHGDAAHLLDANRDYLVQTHVARDGRQSFCVDGRLFFSFTDPQPLKAGYFGLRSTWSRQQVWGFKLVAETTPQK
ncbi:DUF6250 domain-containing protein [Pelomonas sp. SE-A7]|uniref:DUF6250 domain-containing protein n=1 Tax=Pelomonas sp. SE-A7 TaxID=3054953 RepID=UPI00259C6D1A|nr:DUF6250 domain-containing protein [Pelomonas sp. SE-A7]MDM4765210.1 DUF6250 domain-containing protein [Pelomonas sp. SE-A7]